MITQQGREGVPRKEASDYTPRVFAPVQAHSIETLQSVFSNSPPVGKESQGRLLRRMDY